MKLTKRGRWVNVGCSGNDLEVKLFHHHLEIFLETLSKTMKDKNAIIVELGYLNDSNLNKARINKKEKLKKWSGIYAPEETA